MKKYKYLKETRLIKIKKFLFSFTMQVILFSVLIVSFLALCIFLFYQKLTGFSTFNPIDNVPNILREERVVETSSSVDDDSSIDEKKDSKDIRKNIDSNPTKEEKVSDGSSFLYDSKKNEGNLCDYDFSEWNKTCPPELRVVNGSNPIPKDFKPKSLKKFSNRKSDKYKDVRNSVEVSGEVYDSLTKMVNDALKEGVEVFVGSGYRSFDYQNNLFQRKLKEVLKNEKNREKATKIASKRVAKPGQSEHNYGLAIDFYPIDYSFEKTSGCKWLLENAWKYGWVLRYTRENMKDTGVDYEPWHFRYVGDYAGEVKNYKSLEEYAVAKIKQRG